MATKKKAKKKSEVVFDLNDVKGQKGEFVEIPASEFGTLWPDETTKVGGILEGEITGLSTDIGENLQSIITIKAKDGVYAVWESYMLGKLFSLGSKCVGLTVRLMYQGGKKVKGRKQPMKVFRVFIKK